MPYFSEAGAASEEETLGLPKEALVGLLVILPFAFPLVCTLVFLCFLCRGRARDFFDLGTKLCNLGQRGFGGKLRRSASSTPSEPPTKGQITVVVTDIEASTKLWQVCPEEMDTAQVMHDQLLRTLLREHKGYEMMTEGDSFIVVFHTPQHALAWSAALQKALHNAEYSETLIRRFDEVYGPLGKASSTHEIATLGPDIDEELGTDSMLMFPTLADTPQSSGAMRSSNDKRLMAGVDCVRGLRVRIGVHTGPINSFRTDEKTHRFIYDGPTVHIAKAVSHAAAGGQVLISGETMAALAVLGGPDESKENGYVVYSMGRHQLAVPLTSEGVRASIEYGTRRDPTKPSTMDILRTEMLVHGEQAPRPLRTFAPKSIHRCELLYAVPSSLPMRAGYFHRLRTERQLTPSYFESPSKENLTVVFTYIGGSSAIAGWDKEVYDEAVAIMKACVRVTLLEIGGYEIRETQGNFLLGFSSPTAAAEWCVLAQHALLNLKWSKELLSQPRMAVQKDMKEIIWCGLRIGMGICTGTCNSVSPCKRTGRAEYFGHVLNQTARIAHCAAGGQVLCSSLSLDGISPQTIKFLHVKDLGTFRLKGIESPEHIYQLSSPPLDRRCFPKLSVQPVHPDGDNDSHEDGLTRNAGCEVMNSSLPSTMKFDVKSEGNGSGELSQDEAKSSIAPTTEVAAQLDEEQRDYLSAFGSVALSHDAMKSRFVRLAQKQTGVLWLLRSEGSGLSDTCQWNSTSQWNSTTSSGAGINRSDSFVTSRKPLDDATARSLDKELVYIDSWSDFDVFAVERLSGGHALTLVVLATLKALDLHTKLSLDMKIMEKFCMGLERKYEKNDYHAAMHAADVTQAVAVILLAAYHNSKLVANDGSDLSKAPFKSTPGTPCLTPLQEFALVISAAIHDVGHPGVNNKFLVDTSSHFARLYHDHSVNENMHLDIAFKLLEAPEHDVMQMLDQSSRRELRRVLIRTVLQTDMAFHGDLTGKFLDLAEANKGKPVKDWDDPVVALEFILHVADISNPARPNNRFLKWAEMLSEEFFVQGEKEADLGMPVTPFCNRATANIFKNQLGFIDVVVNSSFEALSLVIEPSLHEELHFHLLTNREFYATKIAPTASA